MARSPAPHHPAPHRDHAGWGMVIALTAAPLAWLFQTSANYGLSSHACYPADEPLLTMAARWPWTAALAINIATLLIAAASAMLAFGLWRRTRAEAGGHAATLIEAGEGRTRFLALWGAMIGAGFTLALVFSLIGLLGVPPCGYP